jgi:mannan endo-1,4-beta-mannosidase
MKRIFLLISLIFMKRFGLLFTALCLLFFNLGLHAQMKTSGRNINTQDNEKVVLRGVNEMIHWSSDKNGSWVFKEIAKTGANCVRYSVSGNGSSLTGTELANTIKNANAAGMIAMPAPWDATGEWGSLQACVNYWLRSDIRSAVQNNQKFVLLNISNECGDWNVSVQQFTDGYKNAITQLRNAGYTCPLVIDAPGWGWDYEKLFSSWSALNNHDPRKAIIPSVHTYWNGSDQERRDRYNRCINWAASNNAPLIFGEGPTPTGYDCSSSPYTYALQQCQQNEIGWLAWSWGLVQNGDCSSVNAYNMTTNGNYGSWGSTANRNIAIDNQYSIQKTSQRPASLGGSGGVCTPSAITPYIQVNGGSWQETSSVTVTSGSSVKFGPQPASGGSWSWSGCGTSGSSREQTVSPTSSCTATATYTNSCGAQSTQNFYVTASSGGSNNITIRARGTNGSEHINLKVNNQTIASWTLETSMQNYSASTNNSGAIEVQFDNDASGRDVQVDYITVNGSTLQAENMDYNTGVWQDGSCGGSYSEWLHCSGSIGFGDVSGGGSYNITVRARGTNGSEQIRLTVSGSTVQTWTLGTSMSNYTAPTSNSGVINVEFINDGTNRDVQVDYIQVPGGTWQAENQSTNTGVWQNGSCGGSYSEWLHCNGYIGFSAYKRADVNMDLFALDVENNEVSIYPNPVYDILTVNLPELDDNSVALSIYSANGSLVRNIIFFNQNNSVDLSTLKPGLYVVKLNYNNDIVTGKFMKK